MFSVRIPAILLYLAEGTPLVPDDPVGRAHVWQWLFFEQNLLEPNVGTARFWRQRPQAVSGQRHLRRSGSFGTRPRGRRRTPSLDRGMLRSLDSGERCSNSTPGERCARRLPRITA